MKLTVQVVLHADDETETVVREVFTLQREQPLAPDTLGLQLGEAKDLLAAVGVGTEYARKGPRPGVAPGQGQS